MREIAENYTNAFSRKKRQKAENAAEFGRIRKRRKLHLTSNDKFAYICPQNLWWSGEVVKMKFNQKNMCKFWARRLNESIVVHPKNSHFLFFWARRLNESIVVHPKNSHYLIKPQIIDNIIIDY